MTRVLLVTHEATRSGAPRVAQLAVSSLLDRGIEVLVVSRRPGPLMSEFEDLAPTRLEPWWRARYRLWRVGGRYLAAVPRAFDTLLALATIWRSGCSVVYINSAAAAIYLRPARWLGRRVVLHVHESRDVFVPFLRAAGAEKIPADVQLVACSPSVENDLASLSTDGGNLVLIPSVPDVARVREQGAGTPDVLYPPEGLVVGGVGSIEHRKGVDLLIDVARRVRQLMPDTSVRFVWIGGGDPPEGADGEVEFLGSSSNPYPHMRRFDVAVLPSRDDPFPLVVIEAMALGTPMVAFDVGGVGDQLGGTGVLVRPGDVESFAGEVVALLRSRELRLALGDRARRRAETVYSLHAFADGLHSTVVGAPSPDQSV